ncbi:MAG: CehA/McbA family metallohydrolase [Candidatus Paceibacterota bacterium]
MKIDLHCHTYYSHDALCPPRRLVRFAKKKGLDAIAITDHNTTKAWKEAENEADKIGLKLIKGEEIKIKEDGKTIGEILAYFINKEIDPKGKTAGEIIEEIKNQGGIAIIAHPYHWKKPFKKLEEYKNMVDGIEAFNARSQSKEGNEKSTRFVKDNDLPMTAGSDSHTPFEIGRAYVEADIQTIDELKEAIRNKKIVVRGKQTSPTIQIFAGLAKLIHLFFKP